MKNHIITASLMGLLLLPQLSAQDRSRFQIDLNKAKDKAKKAEELLSDIIPNKNDKTPKDDKRPRDENAAEDNQAAIENKSSIDDSPSKTDPQKERPTKVQPPKEPSPKIPNTNTDNSPIEMIDADIPKYVSRQILYFSKASRAELQLIAHTNNIGILDIVTLDQIGISMVLGIIETNDNIQNVIRRIKTQEDVIWSQPNHYFQLLNQGSNRPKSASTTSREKGLSLHGIISSSSQKNGTILMIDSAVDTNHISLKNTDITQSLYGSKGMPDAHGTAIAELLIGEGDYGGVAAGSKLISLAAFEPTQKNIWLSQTFHLARALNEAVRLRPNVINLSFGSNYDDLILSMLLNKMEEKGICIVSAAGNGNGGKVLFPARHKNTLAITAVDGRKRIYKYASKGPEVDIAAWGVDMNAAVPNGRRTVSGTSFATAIVSGSLMQLDACNENRKPSNMRKIVTQYAQDLGDTGRDTIFGYGLFRLDKSQDAIVSMSINQNEVLKSKTMSQEDSKSNLLYYLWGIGVLCLILLFGWHRRKKSKAAH